MKYIVILFFIFWGSFGTGFSNPKTVSAGFVQLRGVVVHSESKKAIQGVSVEVDGTTMGTITDRDGKFVLWVNPCPDHVIVYHKNYIKKNVKIKRTCLQDINISLERTEVIQTKKRKQ